MKKKLSVRSEWAIGPPCEVNLLSQVLLKVSVIPLLPFLSLCESICSNTWPRKHTLQYTLSSSGSHIWSAHTTSKWPLWRFLCCSARLYPLWSLSSFWCSLPKNENSGIVYSRLSKKNWLLRVHWSCCNVFIHFVFLRIKQQYKGLTQMTECLGKLFLF